MVYNPGLRRLSDYETVGPYGKIGTYGSEREVGAVYLGLGLQAAWLLPPAVRHIGKERHVGDAAKPHGTPYRLLRSVRKRMLLLKWKLLPESHPVELARKRQRGHRS